MPVDQLHLDDIAASVADLFRSLESTLTKQIADRLDRDMDHPYAEDKLKAVRDLQQSARTVLAAINNKVADQVRQSIADAYRGGHATAQTELPADWYPKSGIGARARQATNVIPNAAVIENIANALVNDLGAKSGNVLRDVADAYRRVQAAAAASIVAGVQTRRQAAQSMWRRLVDQGITGFTDTAGRRWRLSSYAEMATRTNAQRAAVQGQTDRLATLGVHLVVVSDHAQECRLCRPFEGKVLSIGGPTGRIQVEHATRDGEPVTVNVIDTLDGARRGGFQHPNCRHSVSAYLPGVTKLPTNTADPEGDKARQRQRAIEREIRKHKERAASALTPEGKRAAAARAREWQKELRNHLAAHPKLKRLPHREQVGAGNIPPGGKPNGGPTSDLGPDGRPTLDGGPGAKPAAPKAEETSSKAPSKPAPKGQQNLLEQKPETSKAPAAKPVDAKAKAEHEAAVRKQAAAEEAKIREQYQPQIDAAKREHEAAGREYERVKHQGGKAAQAANTRRFAARDKLRSVEEHQAAELKKVAARRDAHLRRDPGDLPKARKPSKLDRQIADGEASREKLGGGMIAETHLVHFKDGGKAVHKRAADNGWADSIHQTDAEELGAIVARKLGLRSPQTHKSAPDEIYMEFMGGKVAHAGKKPSKYWESDDGKRMALLDQLIDYPDRHDSNWMHDGKRLTSIDHGIAFTYSHGGKPRKPGEPKFRAQGPFEKTFLKKPKSETDETEWRDNDMSPQDVADARRVLDDLRRDFEDAGRTEWHDRMSQVLDKIAEHAKGVDRWLPPFPPSGDVE